MTDPALEQESRELSVHKQAAKVRQDPQSEQPKMATRQVQGSSKTLETEEPRVLSESQQLMHSLPGRRSARVSTGGEAPEEKWRVKFLCSCKLSSVLV